MIIEDTLDELGEFNEVSQFESDVDNPESTKFALFVKTRQMRQAQSAISHVMLLSKAERQRWVKENKNVMGQLVEQMMEDSIVALDGALLNDAESRALSMEYVSELKVMMNAMRGILREPRKLAT